MKTVTMVAFQTHTRGDGLVKRGEEFEVSEEEAHGYASRKNPLAGPVDGDLSPAEARAEAKSAADQQEAEKQQAAQVEEPAGDEATKPAETTPAQRAAPRKATPGAQRAAKTGRKRPAPRKK